MIGIEIGKSSFNIFIEKTKIVDTEKTDMREKIGTNVKIGMSVTIDTQEKIDMRGRIETTIDIRVIIIMIETLEILTGSGIEIMIDIEKVEMITTTMATEGIPHQGSGTSSDLQRGLF